MSEYSVDPESLSRNLNKIQVLFIEMNKEFDTAEEKFHEIPPLQSTCRQIREILNKIEDAVKNEL